MTRNPIPRWLALYRRYRHPRPAWRDIVPDPEAGARIDAAFREAGFKP